MRNKFLSIALFTGGALMVAIGGMMMALTPNGVSLAMNPQASEPFTDTACLDCHTDKVRLTELAPVPAEDEEAESLSSGPG